MTTPAGKPDNPPVRSVVLGTAGHIDHGKTSLVFALTGMDADRLPEEKARGITIDLGFAALTLHDAKSAPMHVSIIDVPGHHAFVRNMLAGTGGVDCVMLVVAADEGPMPQTREHLAICNLLGIQHGLIVLTKCDLVSAEHLEQTRVATRQLVQGTFLEHAPIAAASARTGAGIAELRDTLRTVLSWIGPPSTAHVLRLPIDREFSMRGFGTVVTGTLQAGTIRPRDMLEVQPGHRSVRIRGVHMHGKTVTQARGPSRVALNLSGVAAGELARGDTLVYADTLSPSRVLDAELHSLTEYPLPGHRAQVRVHAFASESTATVLQYHETSSEERPQLVRLKLREPLLLVPGDRFIVRQTSPALTVAGGYVLDAHPLPRVRKAQASLWLERLRVASPEEQLLLRVERRGMRGVAMAELVRETGMKPETLHALLLGATKAGKLVSFGASPGASPYLLWDASLAQVCRDVAESLLLAPEAPVSRAELASRTKLEPTIFHLLWDRLRMDARLLVSIREVRARETAPLVDPAAALRLKLEKLYRDAGLSSPILSKVAAAMCMSVKQVWPLTTHLLRQGTLVRTNSDDLLVHAEAVAGLRTLLAAHRHERFDVARFKSFTGLSRKHAIPLLELLDRTRVTRNENGTRVVL